MLPFAHRGPSEFRLVRVAYSIRIFIWTGGKGEGGLLSYASRLYDSIVRSKVRARAPSLFFFSLVSYSYLLTERSECASYFQGQKSAGSGPHKWIRESREIIQRD